MIKRCSGVSPSHTVSLTLDNSFSDDKSEDSDMAVFLTLCLLFFRVFLSLLFPDLETDFCFRIGFAGRKSSASASASVEILSETVEGVRFLYDLFLEGVSSAFRFPLAVLAAFPLPLGTTTGR
jgi:hypothetical protein